MKKVRVFNTALFVLGLALIFCAPTVWSAGNPLFGFITNGVNDFWILSQRGVEQAQKDLNVSVDFRTPPNGTMAEQQSIVDDLMAKGAAGIAITVIDPDGMTPYLNSVAARVPLITFDSDAVKSKRIVYIGTNNYHAGRTMGKLVKEVLPNGGELMLQVGKLDVQNAWERRQGIIDELKNVPYTGKYVVSNPGKVECGKWTILDTRTDNVDYQKAKANAEDAIISYPNLKLFVGLWAYEAPMILSALKDAGKAGQIKVLAHDELADTLQGIVDGFITATVVQDPYNFGYRSIEILSKLVKGDKSMVPANGIIYIPERVINKDNVQVFWDDMKKKLGK